jgi:uncharacterized OB-fold protein
MSEIEITAPQRRALRDDAVHADVVRMSAERNAPVAQRCRACDGWQFPPRLRCGACGSASVELDVVSGRGTVWSFGVSEHRRRSGERTRHVSIVVECDEGPRLLATALEVVPIGDRVQMHVEVEHGVGFLVAVAERGLGVASSTGSGS